MSNTMADYDRLAAAVKTVLMGTPIDDLNRNDDGMEYNDFAPASVKQVKAWRQTLQDALNGIEAPPVRKQQPRGALFNTGGGYVGLDR